MSGAPIPSLRILNPSMRVLFTDDSSEPMPELPAGELPFFPTLGGRLPLLLSRHLVASLIGVRPNSVWKLCRVDPTFPRPVHIGLRCTRWRAADIERWAAELPARADINPVTEDDE